MVATLKVNQIESVNGNSDISIPAGTRIVGTDAGSIVSPGGVVQVVQTVFKSTFSTSAGPSFAEVTGMRTDITPKFADSKILIRVGLCIASQYWQVRGRLLRDGSVINDARGDAASSRAQVAYNYIKYGGGSATSIYDMTHIPIEYLDSPATTSSVRYSLDIGGYSTSYPVYVNRNHNYTDSTSHIGAPFSTMTLTEIAQ
jgi:hypothetical protein